MRIIAGTFRGRRLRTPRGKVRPTADRVREAWLNVLEPEIAGAGVLDLFAGSGALGLEALSRGARSADFVELARPCLDALRANIRMLGLEGQTRVVREDAVRFVRRLAPGAYDVAFADPPYDTHGAVKIAATFRETPFARILGVEHRAAVEIAGDRTRRYGDIAITFLYAP